MRAPGGAAASMRSNARWTSSPSKLNLDPVELRLALLLRSRPERGHPLHQQEAARVLRARRAGVRMGQAQSGAALDARRQRTGRLGHGDRRVGSDADEDRGADRADRQRPCRGRMRDLRHRHRHLHHHDAGRGRRCWACRSTNVTIQLGDSTLPLLAARGRLVDGGIGVERDRRHRRSGAQGAAAASPGRSAARRSPARRPTMSCSRTAASCSRAIRHARCRSRTRCGAARWSGSRRNPPPARTTTDRAPATRIRRSSPR